MNNKSFDLIVVGGGVLGTFHAYSAIQKGLRVAVIEKNTQPQGATVKNFGQVVPSGMNTKWQNYGRESLAIYKESQSKFDISIRQNGTVYIASNPEEVQLIEELYQINKFNNYTSQLLTKKQCLSKYASLCSSYCEAGLFFPEEVTVESRIMINRLHSFMKMNPNFELFTNEIVVDTQEIGNGVEVVTAKDNKFKAEKVIICNGSDFKALYPEIYDKSDLVVTKLQMLQTKAQKNYVLNGSILTGLSIRRYEAFEECASWKNIKEKESSESLENKYGVHILFKQATDGSIILGDSHEYADAKNMDDLGFDLNMDIDNFMIQEAKKIFDLPTYEIQNRWFGMYSQCKNSDIFQYNVSPNVHIVTGIGGKGMTGSAGFSKDSIQKLINKK